MYANGLSIEPTKGANRFVKIRGGITPKTFVHTKRIAKNTPIMMIEIGIISKERETKSGTDSGILMVKLRFLHQRNNSTATIAPNIDANKPLAPKYFVTKVPSSEKSTASIKNAINAILMQPGASSSCDFDRWYPIRTEA